jgi:uncharacterized repeat protein (TIGR01451 family)
MKLSIHPSARMAAAIFAVLLAANFVIIITVWAEDVCTSCGSNRESIDPLVTVTGGKCAADLVFLLDTSDSMCNEWNSLCAVLDRVVLSLNGSYSVNHYVVGLMSTPKCPGSVGCVDIIWPSRSREDWGPALTHFSESYPWREGAIKFLIPISDEGCLRGCPVNKFDDKSISEAILAARKQGVLVYPLLGNITDTQECSSKDQVRLMNSMDSLAGETGGERFNITGESDLAAAIIRIVEDNCCELLIKERSTPPAIIGGELDYIIDVCNNCSEEAVGVIIEDALDKNVSYISCSSESPEIACSYDPLRHTVSWSVPRIEPHGCVQLRVKVHIEEEVHSGDELLNRAKIVSTLKYAEVTDIAGKPAIEVEKTMSPSAGEPSSVVQSVIIVMNSGDYTLDPVSVVDILPHGLSYLSDEENASVSGRNLTWSDLGPLGPGKFKTIHLQARIDPGTVPGLLDDWVTARGLYMERQVEDRAHASISVLGRPDTNGSDTCEINALNSLFNLNNVGEQIASYYGSGNASNLKMIKGA